jgi:hypothetical protein
LRSTGDMYGLVPAPDTDDVTRGGVEVKRFQELEAQGGDDDVDRSWAELGSKTFAGVHAVFGLSAVDRIEDIFYCLLYNPNEGVHASGRLIGLTLPEPAMGLGVETADSPAELVVIRNISMPLMLSSLSHDIGTGKLLGVA